RQRGEKPVFLARYAVEWGHAAPPFSFEREYAPLSATVCPGIIRGGDELKIACPESAYNGEGFICPVSQCGPLTRYLQPARRIEPRERSRSRVLPAIPVL